MRNVPATLSVVTCVALLAWPAAQGKTLDVYWIDMEGGAATLIVTPEGESVLIDSGYPDERGAPRIHKVAAGVAGLTRIDHLVITHFHNDHFGGAAHLAKLIPIGQVHDNGSPSPPPSEKDAPLFAEYQQAFPAGRRTLLNPGDVIALAQASGAPRLSLTLLGTRQTFIAPGPGAARNDVQCRGLSSDPPDNTDNANSTVWLLRFGAFRFFDAGDLTWNIEAKLACPVNLVGRVDVYQVTHHGLDWSNNDVLVRSLAPTVSIMNNGARKGTERRTVATLKSLASLRGLYQLHKNVRDDKEQSTTDEYIANLDEQCTANYIRMRVSPDAKGYTVEIPARGHTRVYDTSDRE
jgi:competence protein ComEC